MAMRVLTAVLAAAMTAGVASPQSMGDAAQKERERREKLKEKGGQAAVVTSDELKANKGSLANDPKGAPGAPLPSAAPTRAARPTPEPDRQVREEEWRRRMTLAREQVAKWERYYEYWNAQHLAPNDYFIDENGRKIVGSAESLRKLIADAKANLDNARAALEALEEQARRENVPPGWLR